MRAVGGVPHAAAHEERVQQLELELEIDLVFGHEGDGSFDEIHDRLNVSTQPRAPRCRRQTPASLFLQNCVLSRAELATVPAGLLEVVAEDFVQLDQLATVLLEPVRELLVQIGPGRFGKRVVRRVADEEMAEAEGVVPRDLRAIRADERLADERGEARRHLSISGERLDGAAVEDLPFDRASLQDRALGRLQLVEARGEQGPEVGRNRDVAFRLARHRNHLLHEQRVSACCALDPFAQLVFDRVGNERVDVLSWKRLETHGDSLPTPAGARSIRAGPCRRAEDALLPRRA